jgi:hypothetical protein
MSESFLHYAWQFQYFAKGDLRLSSGESLSIFNVGHKNSDAGPDFLQARVRMDGIDWIGSVEIHILASGWHDHKHDLDKRYENVVLHVVPTLELMGRIDDSLLQRYKELLNSLDDIPCSGVFQSVSSIRKHSMVDNALTSRLESRTLVIQELLRRNGNDWEETCYQLIARSFGFKVNAEPFLRLAQGLSLKTLLKHGNRIDQLEALLFGQAGFLDQKSRDDYHRLLKREYHLLRQKYQLEKLSIGEHHWKFLRMRPANFPTIRLAQLAMLIYSQKNLFSRFLHAQSYTELKEILSVQQTEYWRTHYNFGKVLKQEVSMMGTESMNMIIINTVVPLMVASGRIRDEQYLIDRAINMLHEVPPESNAITRRWETLHMNIRSAFDSQGLIELHQNFCLKHRCLECVIGASLIKPAG